MSPIALLAQAAPAEVEACGPPEESSAVCRAVFELTNSELVAQLSNTLVVKPAKILLIVVLAFIVSRLLRRVIRRFVDGLKGERVRQRLGSIRERAPDVLIDTSAATTVRSAQRAETIGALLRSVSTFIVWTIAVFMVLGEIGLNLGPLIAGAGIVGVAIGFGAQNLVRDFLTGIFMLMEDQYGVGDIIDAGEATGIVEAVTLRTTRLRSVDGTVWHIPNGTIARVGNKSQQWSRALLDIEVAYGTDIDRASEVIRACAHQIAGDPDWRHKILEEPEVWGVEMLGASGIAIRLVIKTVPGEQWGVMRELRRRIKASFDAAGIEIPFPQRTVWIRQEGSDRPKPEPEAAPQAKPEPARRSRKRAGPAR